MDIVLYTTPEKLLHKQGKLPNDPDHSSTGYYVWYLSKMPTEIEELDKIYIATKGFIRGYFIITDVCRGCDTNYIEWHCDTWKEVEPIPCKHFQGFKYLK